MQKEYQKERSHENFKRSNDCDYIELMFDDIAKKFFVYCVTLFLDLSSIINSL